MYPYPWDLLLLHWDNHKFIPTDCEVSLKDMGLNESYHDDVIKWKHFPRNWPFVQGIHRFPVNSPHKGQWRGALMFSLVCVGLNGWINNREAGDLRRYRTHHDVTVMEYTKTSDMTTSKQSASKTMCMFYGMCYRSAKWNQGPDSI